MASVIVFQTELLAWYVQHKRDLPWRNTDDPYKILVSEIMLQQTQVPRVIPIYNNFLKQFPTAKDLASAELGEVLKAWKGLGYNRRAKLLWECSKLLPYGRNKNVAFPETEETLRALPGVGHYTAAAILAFWANRDAIPIDTNVRRVHFRYFGDASPEHITSTLPSGRARDWNSALMDFGSLICAKTPKCTECLLRESCAAYAKQDFAVPVAKQAPFKESNRFYSGRIIDALREGPQTKQQLRRLGTTEKIERALASLEKDGMLRMQGKHYTL